MKTDPAVYRKLRDLLCCWVVNFRLERVAQAELELAF